MGQPVDWQTATTMDEFIASIVSNALLSAEERGGLKDISIKVFVDKIEDGPDRGKYRVNANYVSKVRGPQKKVRKIVSHGQVYPSGEEKRGEFFSLILNELRGDISSYNRGLNVEVKDHQLIVYRRF
ncbi:MAG: hypothetical protein Q7S74_00815 [Nanoarchaeota archaeon]|nr:hypothetical protein [Nanoarchaeota archaeon]